MRVLSLGRRTVVRGLAFSANGRLAAAAVGGVHVWDLAGAAEPVRLPLPRVNSLAFLPDGRLLTRARYQAALFVSDPAAGAPAVLPFVIRGHHARSALAPGGGWLAVGGSRRLAVREVGGAWPERWSHPAGQSQAFWCDPAPSADRVAVVRVDWSHRPRRVTLMTRDAATGRLLDEAESPFRGPVHLLASPDGARLVAQAVASFAVVDAADLSAKPRKVTHPGRRAIRGMAFHPSGRLLATVGDGPEVRFWDAGSWAEARVFAWTVGPLAAVAFSPDGALAAAGSRSGQVVVWDVDV